MPRARQATACPDASARATPGLPAADYFRLAPDGELWVCECDGRTFRLRDSRGMQMLARLVAGAGKRNPCARPDGAASADHPIDSGDAANCWTIEARANTAASSNRCASSSRKPRA